MRESQLQSCTTSTGRVSGTRSMPCSRRLVVPITCWSSNTGRATIPLAHILQAYPAVEVVEIHANRGPIAGNNHALQATLAKQVDAVLLMCDDSRSRRAPATRRADGARALPRRGATRRLPRPGRTDDDPPLGGYLDARTRHIIFTSEPGDVSTWVGRTPHSVDWVEGGVILFRAEAARQTGSLDEAILPVR